MAGTVGRGDIIQRILDFSHFVTQYEDINTVMDVTLSGIRKLTGADAGTFYLAEKGALRFAYVQNDTIFGDDSSNKQLYTNSVIPIDPHSISGYAALTKSVLNIADVDHLPPELPFTFNRSYDVASGYHTLSVLTVPILGTGGKVFAILQLINCKNYKGEICAFSKEAQRNTQLLASQALAPLMRAIGTRRLIERMLDMATMHDPFETGGHVQRVGAYSAEIYTRWAKHQGISEAEILSGRDSIRLSAMLHDIGKIGVPSSILKKPGKLTPEEFNIMKTHCARGASLYGDCETPLEQMAFEITLNHHQNWDGRGYTGSDDYPILEGTDIPIHARIVSVADVFDALLSPRCYKEPWSFELTIEELKKCSGTKFDPEVVDVTIEIMDTLKAIRARFPDSLNESDCKC